MKSLRTLTIIILAFCLLLAGCQSKESRYDKGISLMLEGQFEQALSIFKALGDFKDSEEKLRECENHIDYQRAKGLMANEEYRAAQDILRGLSGFLDADALFRECTNAISYHAALEQMEAGELDQAINEFRRLGDFRDSPARLEEAQNLKRYNNALELLESGDFEGARAIFAALGDFRDSAEQLQKIDGLHEEELWTKALAANTFEAFAPFLENPDGRYYEAALERAEEILWNSAIQRNSFEGYREYLDNLPNGRHAEDAKRALENLAAENNTTEFEAAVDADTILALLTFIEGYSQSAHVAEALAKIEEMKADSKYFEPVRENPTQESVSAFLRDYPGHMNVAEANTLLQSFSGTLRELLDRNVIRATISGGAMQRCTLKIENRTDNTVTVNLIYGTNFIARDTSYDNMLLTQEYTLTVGPKATITQDVAAASMNMNRKMPGKRDTFAVGVFSSANRLVKLLPVLERNGVGYPVIQAAIWMVEHPSVTDRELMDSLFYGDGTPVITRSDVRAARNLVGQV